MVFSQIIGVGAAGVAAARRINDEWMRAADGKPTARQGWLMIISVPGVFRPRVRRLVCRVAALPGLIASRVRSGR